MAKLGLGIVAVILGQAIAFAAQAGDVACLWNALPVASKSAYLADYAKNGPVASKSIQLDRDSFTQALTACGLEKTKPETLGAAFSDYAWQAGAASVLKSRNGIDESAILAAWDGLPQTDRQDFTAAVVAGSPLKSDIVDKVVAQLKAPADAHGQLAVYLISHALLTDAQSRF